MQDITLNSDICSWDGTTLSVYLTYRLTDTFEFVNPGVLRTEATAFTATAMFHSNDAILLQLLSLHYTLLTCTFYKVRQ